MRRFREVEKRTLNSKLQDDLRRCINAAAAHLSSCERS
jgi:hypothetical protein